MICKTYFFQYISSLLTALCIMQKRQTSEFIRQSSFVASDNAIKVPPSKLFVYVNFPFEIFNSK